MTLIYCFKCKKNIYKKKKLQGVSLFIYIFCCYFVVLHIFMKDQEAGRLLSDLGL